MFQVSHIRRGLLLVLSTCVPAHASYRLLDQWLADCSRRLDNRPECHVWYLFLWITTPSIIKVFSQELLNFLSLVLEYTILNGSQRRGKHAGHFI